jgi:hypothetical protein
VNTRVEPGPEENTFVLRGQVIRNVHLPEACAGMPCTVHGPTEHKLAHMPLLWRDDRGLFERVCPCGVGHPDPDQRAHWSRTGRIAEQIHGCCGIPEHCG